MPGHQPVGRRLRPHMRGCWPPKPRPVWTARLISLARLPGKGKACQETRRLAVIAPDALTEADIITLEVSPTGITPSGKYVLLLQGKGLHPVQVSTEVAFRSYAAYPTLTFSSPQVMGDEALALAFSLKDAAVRMLDRGASN